jgi:hypothetical protein
MATGTVSGEAQVHQYNDDIFALGILDSKTEIFDNELRYLAMN